MALNKKQTSLFVKIGIIAVAFMLVVSLLPWDGLGFGNSAQNTPATSGAVAEVATRYASTAQLYSNMLASEPTSYTVLVNQGNMYFDWGLDLQNLGAEGVTGSEIPVWIAAINSYERAVAVEPGDPPVEINLAILYHYAGRTTDAIAKAEEVGAATPDFSLTWFNLGIFYESIGQADSAVAAFERYLEVDPEGQRGDIQFVRDSIARLSGEGAQGDTSQPATGALSP